MLRSSSRYFQQGNPSLRPNSRYLQQNIQRLRKDSRSLQQENLSLRKDSLSLQQDGQSLTASSRHSPVPPRSWMVRQGHPMQRSRCLTGQVRLKTFLKTTNPPLPKSSNQRTCAIMNLLPNSLPMTKALRPTTGNRRPGTRLNHPIQVNSNRLSPSLPAKSAPPESGTNQRKAASPGPAENGHYPERTKTVNGGRPLAVFWFVPFFVERVADKRIYHQKAIWN